MSQLRKDKNSIFKEEIDDFRAMIESISWDNDYDGRVFRSRGCDTPEKHTDLVRVQHTITLPRAEAAFALRIVSTIGEELLIINRRK